MTETTNQIRAELADLAEIRKTLPARSRQAVRAASEAGLDNVEIAFRLGVSVATVGNWLKEASD